MREGRQVVWLHLYLAAGQSPQLRSGKGAPDGQLAITLPTSIGSHAQSHRRIAAVVDLHVDQRDWLVLPKSGSGTAVQPGQGLLG